MSKSHKTDLVCLLVTAFMIISTVLFMNGEKLGITAAVSDETANLTGQFSNRDLDPSWDESTAVYIDLDELEGLTYAGAYELDGNLYIIAKGTYVLSGTLDNAQIIVDADDCKVQIVLNGVTVTNETEAPLWVKDADKVFVTLAEGSVNTLSLTGTLTEEQTENSINAAVYSRDDLTFNGSGSLTVNSTEYNGIRSSDDLVITGGTITVNAGNNGIVGHDSLRICDGTITVTAGKDGLKSNNDEGTEDTGYLLVTGGTFVIDAANDAVQAETDLTITGGDFTVVTGDGASEVSMGGIGGMDMGGMELPDMSGTEGSSDSGMPSGGTMPDMGSQGSFGSGMPSGGTMPDMGSQGSFGSGMPGGETGRTDSFSSLEGVTIDGTAVTITEEGAENILAMLSQMGIETEYTAEDLMAITSAEELYALFSAGGMPSGGQEIMPGEETAADTSSDDTPSMKGLKAGTSITISGGTFDLNCEDDAVHCDGTCSIKGGTFTLASSDDAIHADEQITIDAGTITVTACYEGIEAKTIIVNDGEISVTASDDAFNASDGSGTVMMGGFGNTASSETADLALLEINGGTIYVNAGGDGLDSNGDLIINGGDIAVDGPSDGANGALDSGSESGGDLAIHGGTIIAVGSSQMAEGFSSSSTQANFMVTFSSSLSAGSTIVITDSEGNEIYSYTLAKSADNIVFSSEDLVQGETYTVTCGNQSQTVTAVLESSSSGSMMPGGMGSGGMGGSFGGGMPSDGSFGEGMPSDGSFGQGAMPGGSGGFGGRP